MCHASKVVRKENKYRILTYVFGDLEKWCFMSPICSTGAEAQTQRTLGWAQRGGGWGVGEGSGACPRV